MTINSARDKEGRVDPEEGVFKRGLVLSYADCTHYLIGTTRDPPGNIVQVELLRDEVGSPRRYGNLSRAQLALEQMGFAPLSLLMHSAYDEMIGSEKAGPAELPLAPLPKI